MDAPLPEEMSATLLSAGKTAATIVSIVAANAKATTEDGIFQ
jgi:hypothetical protein